MAHGFCDGETGSRSYEVTNRLVGLPLNCVLTFDI
jgi:hypothetical protein